VLERSYDWDDLRSLLAVARGGSTLAASRALGVSQSTIARRLDSLEHALGAVLVERSAAGARLTEDGRKAVEIAERVEREAAHLSAAFPTAARRQGGPLRVTTNEMLARTFLAQVLSDLQRRHPDSAFEVIVSDERLDLMRGEADLALRAGSRPDDPGLVRAKMPALAWGIYGSAGYVAERGAPRSADELVGHALVLGTGIASRLPSVAWLESAAPNPTGASRSNSLTALLQAVKSGLGLSMLPMAAADLEPDLTLCFQAPVAFEDEIWITYPQALKDDPRLRRLVDEVTARMRAAR